MRRVVLLAGILAAIGGCAKTHGYYRSEKAPCFVFKRHVEYLMPWDSLVLVKNSDGLDLVLNPYEPASGAEGRLYLGISNRSRNLELLLEETAVIDESEMVHWPITEELEGSRIYTVAIPPEAEVFRKEVGPSFQCATRLGYREVDLQGALTLTVRFTYVPAGSAKRKRHEIRLRRREVTY